MHAEQKARLSDWLIKLRALQPAASATCLPVVSLRRGPKPLRHSLAACSATLATWARSWSRHAVLPRNMLPSADLRPATDEDGTG